MEFLQNVAESPIKGAAHTSPHSHFFILFIYYHISIIIIVIVIIISQLIENGLMFTEDCLQYVDFRLFLT